jgi:hypothetical protein
VGKFLTRSALRQARGGPTVYVHGVFETVTILLSEAARVVHRRTESFAIRLLARTPAVLTRVFTLGGAAQELYPDVVDACEEEGGVPSRLLKTDAGDGRQEGTPWRMFAGSLSGRASRAGSRLMVSRARVRVG